MLASPILVEGERLPIRRPTDAWSAHQRGWGVISGAREAIQAAVFYPAHPDTPSALASKKAISRFIARR